MRLDLFTNGTYGSFKGIHICLSGLHFAKIFLDKITLNVHHHTVGQRKAVAVKGRHQCLFLFYATAYQLIYFRVLCLYR